MYLVTVIEKQAARHSQIKCHCQYGLGGVHGSRSAVSLQIFSIFSLSHKIMTGGIFSKIRKISWNFDHPPSFWCYLGHVRWEIWVNFHD